MNVIKIQGPYRRRTSDGRQFIILTYEDGSKSTKAYARYLMEKKLGRTLGYNEVVDHIDGDCWNDSESNLQVISRTANCQKAIIECGRSAQIIKVICYHCKQEFELKNAEYNARMSKQLCNITMGQPAKLYCSKVCAGKGSNGGYIKIS